MQSSNEAEFVKIYKRQRYISLHFGSLQLAELPSIVIRINGKDRSAGKSKGEKGKSRKMATIASWTWMKQK